VALSSYGESVVPLLLIPKASLNPVSATTAALLACPKKTNNIANVHELLIQSMVASSIKEHFDARNLLVSAQQKKVPQKNQWVKPAHISTVLRT
jgi:hypothetical protein